MIRRRLTVAGVVQGIGFRPFVYRLATDRSLTGFVNNDGRGVTIEIQGASRAVEGFADGLRDGLPAGGRIDQLRVSEASPRAGEDAFEILASEAGAQTSSSLAPDRAVCDDCLAELGDPADRRHRYPFVNCTRCGPRYTITRALPYDRPQTTMAGFPLCPECAAEYGDPLDRRYHAQPIACPVCGPRAWLEQAGQPRAEGAAAIGAAAGLLKDGRVVAVKGIGGFHLAANARDAAAVERLRNLKRRPRKPLAVMVRDREVARRMVHLDRAGSDLLRSPAAPILLAPRRRDAGLAPRIAPGLDDLGVMLPYSPLHHLLFDGDLDALVMTSGNRSAEPITIDNREAREQLPADAHLMHDRPIEVPNDDSVIRTGHDHPVSIRRSRGYVPEPLDGRMLPPRPLIGLGALLKVTVGTLQHGELVVGRHLGDLDNLATERCFVEEVERVLSFSGLEPQAVAVDLHPDLPSRRLAQERFGDLPLIEVQHHHAHLAAVLAEHGITPETRAVGIVLDGFGYGLDGTSWGGEVLVGSYAGSARAGHLRPIPQPGGDRAALEPGRMGTSLLVDAGIARPDLPGFLPEIAEICGVSSVSPLTSSAGRLFDGIAALLELAPERQDYEGEAAALLEAAADPREEAAYPLPLAGRELDTRVLVHALVEDPAPAPIRAARFHNGLADGLAELARATDARLVALGGGCMINRLLTRRLTERLRAAGRRVLLPRRLPPGDGAISAGQVACAACRLEEGA